MGGDTSLRTKCTAKEAILKEAKYPDFHTLIMQLVNSKERATLYKLARIFLYFLWWHKKITARVLKEKFYVQVYSLPLASDSI